MKLCRVIKQTAIRSFTLFIRRKVGKGAKVMSVDDTDGKAVRYMNDMAHSFISEFVKNARVYSGTDYKFPFLFERPSVSKSKMCCVQYK